MSNPGQKIPGGRDTYGPPDSRLGKSGGKGSGAGGGGGGSYEMASGGNLYGTLPVTQDDLDSQEYLIEERWKTLTELPAYTSENEADKYDRDGYLYPLFKYISALRDYKELCSKYYESSSATSEYCKKIDEKIRINLLEYERLRKAEVNKAAANKAVAFKKAANDAAKAGNSAYNSVYGSSTNKNDKDPWGDVTNQGQGGRGRSRRRATRKMTRRNKLKRKTHRK